MRPDIKPIIVIGVVFFILFLALTPLGLFDDGIPNNWHTGYYSITQIDTGDDTGYYVYLRSAFFDGDLDFINEKKYAHIEHFTSTGYVFNNWSIGQSILFIPFFFLGHLSAILLNNFGFSFLLDGYSTPYFMATAVASQTYVFFSLLILYRILTKYFNQTSTLVVTIGVWLASPLIYYSFIRQRMTHTTEIFMAVVFIYFWLKYRESESLEKHSILGLILGFLCLVRIINISFFALYFIDQLIIRKYYLPKFDKKLIKGFSLRSSCMILFFLIALSPQLFIWHKINGIPLPIRNIALASNSLALTFNMDLLKKIFDVFLSPQWGLFFSFPIFLLSIAGFFVNKKLNCIRGGIFAYIASMIFIVSIYPKSDAYGERHFISSIPLLAIGLIGVMERLKKYHNGLKFGVLLIVLFGILQYLMLIQYKIWIPYNHPEFTLKALTEIPSLFIENSQLLSRSTNFFRILFFAKFESFSKETFLFLILFPSAQLACVLLASFIFLGLTNFFRDKNKSIKKLLVLITLFILFFNFYLYKITPNKTPQQIKLRHMYRKLVIMGDNSAEKGNINEGLQFFTIASKKIPSHWGAYLRKSFAYDTLSNYGMANHYYKKVLELNQYHVDSYRNLGINNFRLRHFKEAELFLKKSVKLNPLNKFSFFYLALLFAEKKQTEEANKMFKIVFTLDPNFKNAHLKYAVLLAQTNQIQKSNFHFNEAYRLGVKMKKIKELVKQIGLSFTN